MGERRRKVGTRMITGVSYDVEPDSVPAWTATVMRAARERPPMGTVAKEKTIESEIHTVASALVRPRALLGVASTPPSPAPLKRFHM
jgi:hypothetical protein